ncbi:hypothetical protein LOTGIDRAFT_104988 [Lottia gigantea]|uniref:C2H2-type domain-containing protein n=1 Tax=Lottia gigantea TaxID=225164 RepID=V3ZQJ9_LOTGI|nr:hypothetical protein LOTGIDRAFT_104988 [Lottia gigantea]ESO93678.1 hypothetical protein LOTGIDRAFT_104988 [Lottia gigantea]
MSPPLGGVKCEDDDESAFQIPDDDSPFSTLPLPDVTPDAIPTVSRPGIPNTIHAQSAALTHPDGYVCRRCFQVLPDTSAFESHNLRVHTLFTCKICFRAFTARNNLKRHIRLHTGVKPYKCPICNQGFTRKDDLKGHELRHSFKKPFRCNICKKGYTDRSCVRNHMAKEHNMKLQHVCPRCGEGFSSSEKFTEHKKTHPEFKNYRCETCDFIGVNGLMHIKHQLTHQDKTYSCKPCNNTYDDPFEYSEHLKIHRVDESFKSYQCCFCGSLFTPSLLFKCHSSFQCIECSKVFTDFNQFETHSAILHRRFLCEFCGKVFTAKPNRDRHLRYHTGERPYKCGLCDASFFRGDDLKYHRTTKHASEKPFVCDVCGLNFAWPKDLQRHRKQKKHFKI